MLRLRKSQITLPQGSSQRLSMPAGTQLLVRHGEVEVHGPLLWISETMLCAQTRLSEGQGHCVEQAGWVEIVALRDARIVRQTPVGPALRAAHWLWERWGRRLGRREVQPRVGH